jgi:hypothetical protein
MALGVVASSALAAGGSLASGANSTIYDSTPAGALPGNLPSYGAEAYGFRSLGDKVHLAGVARKLSNVAVTMSSWACQRGGWDGNDCATQPGATFEQPITLTIWNEDHSQLLASSQQTFKIPYRPSASSTCAATDRPGGWYQPATQKCFNGLANRVTFGFAGNVTLPDTVVYEISYNTNTHGPSPLDATGPSDSLNIAFTSGARVGSDIDPTTLWVDGTAQPIAALDSSYSSDSTTPAVQFNAAKLWKANS